MLHEFCRKSVVYLNSLYIDATPDISDGGILQPAGFWEATFFVAPYLWSLCRAMWGRHWVFYCIAGGQHEAMLLCSSAPFHMIEVTSAHLHERGHSRLREDLSKRACVCRSVSSWFAAVLSKIATARGRQARPVSVGETGQVWRPTDRNDWTSGSCHNLLECGTSRLYSVTIQGPMNLITLWLHKSFYQTIKYFWQQNLLLFKRSRLHKSPIMNKSYFF